MKMRTRLAFTLLLLRCVFGSEQFQHEILFSEGIELFVKGLQSMAPSAVILTSVAGNHDTAPVLVCVLSGLEPTHTDITWWVDDTEVDPKHNTILTAREHDGTLTVTGVWNVSAEEWNPSSGYSCGVIQAEPAFKNGFQSSPCFGFT